MILPTLYKTTKTGATQICKISTVEDIIEVEFGQLDGKMQFKHTPCFGKNAGKSNATTDTEQAESEAQSKWERKVKDGYSTEIAAPKTTRVQAMKVKVLQAQEKNVIYPCVSTPKLNGICAIYKNEATGLKLYSRTGEEYPEIYHQHAEILEVMHHMNTNEINVELYIHGEHLQDIASAVKKPKELSKKLEAAIFAICDSGLSYEKDRIRMIGAELHLIHLKSVTFLTGVWCKTREDIEDHYNQCIKRNLEGTVVKNLRAKYEHGIRSSDMFKYKKTLDAEFRIINHNIDKNNEVVWIMAVNDNTNTTFKCKPKGERAYRQQLAVDAKNYYGTWWTIEYETMSKDNIPLKPVGIGPRECDKDGIPRV